MELTRLTDPLICQEVTNLHLDYFTFDVEDWFQNPLNYALINKDNVGFAEYKSEGVYWVHFCFNTARGREAMNLSKAMLESLFIHRPAKTAIGIISCDNKKARWLIRQIGFTSLGFTETKNGTCEMFYYTKDNN